MAPPEPRQQQQQQQQPPPIIAAVPVSPLVKYSVFLGVFLSRIGDCVSWIWGNYSIYVTSYFHAHGDEHTQVLTHWLFMVNVAGFTLGVLIGGYLGSTFGDIPVIFVAILLYNSGLFLAYVSLNYSAVVMCATLGAMNGLGGGLIQCLQLRIVVRWTNRYHGLVTSWVTSFNIVVAMVVNPALTWYINPRDLQPDGATAAAGGIAIFTQKDLIRRVPTTLLFYAVSSIVLNVTGFLLLRDRPGSKNIFTKMMYLKCSKFKCTNSTEDTLPILRAQTDVQSEPDCAHSILQRTDNVGETNGHRSAVTDEDEGNNLPSPSSDMALWEVLKGKEFYTLWTVSVAQTYAFYILNTYYKTLGISHIADDHFLTIVGTTIPVLAPGMSWLSGFAMDKFGVKPTMVLLSCLSTVVAGVFYLTRVDKWLYLVASMVYGGTLCTVYSLTPSVCVKLFGETNFTSVFGLIMTSTFVLTLTAPPLAGWLIVTWGWWVLFSTGALACLLGTVALVCGLSEIEQFSIAPK